MLRVETLEERSLLTTTLFLDFGDRFDNGQMVDTEGNLTAINGPELTGNPGTSLTFTSFAATVAAANGGNGIDYDGDNDFDANDVTALRQAVIALVQRYYSPFNIAIVELTDTNQSVEGANVRAAANLAEAAATLSSNDGKTTKFDAYVFVTGITANGLDPDKHGEAGGNDHAIATNTTDDVAVVIANHIFNHGHADSSADTALAYTIAHEAAHTFGLRHTENSPQASNDARMLTQSDMISQFYDAPLSQEANQLDNFNMFSRFPMPNAGNPTTTYIPYDIIAMAGITGAAYITGTGAFDRIVISKIDDTFADVTVEAYRDNTFSANSLIDTYQYAVEYAQGLLIDAGFGDDRIIIDALLSVAVTLRGMAGNDELVIAGGNVASGEYTPNPEVASSLDGRPSFGGTVIAGSTTIVFSEFEPTGSVRVENIVAFTFKSPGGSDDLAVGSTQAGTNRISGTVNGLTGIQAVPLVFTGVTAFTLDASNNDGGIGTSTNDKVTIGSAGLIATGLSSFILTTGDGDDTLAGTLTGAAITYHAGDGNDTLRGPALSNLWEISGQDTGQLNGLVSFDGVENLIGNTGTDAFVFANQAGISGNIDGKEGADSLDFSSSTAVDAGFFVDLGTGTIDERKGDAVPIGGQYDNIGLVSGLPKVIVTQSGGTAVAEGDGGDTYTIVLGSAPTANVTITVQPNSALTVSTFVLTFTPSNWDVAQTVSVSVADDGLGQGTRTLGISHSASSLDARYHGLTIASVDVTVTEHLQFASSDIGHVLALSPQGSVSGVPIAPAAVATDAAGNVYVVGSFTGKVDFDPSSATQFRTNALGTQAAFIAKYTATGTLAWVHQFEVKTQNGASSSTDVTLDSLGNVYIVGSYQLQIDFNPGAATTALSSATPRGFLAKFDGNGNFSWVRDVSDPAWYVGADNADSIYVGHGDSVPRISTFSSGNQLYERPVLPTLDNAGVTTIAVDGAGNLYASGVAANQSPFVYKLNGAGGVLWANTLQIAGLGAGFVTDFAFDAADNVYSAGNAGGAAFVARLNSTNGAVLWSSQEGSGPAVSAGLATDASGNVYSTYAGGGIGFLAKRDSNGSSAQVLWSGTPTAGVTVSPHAELYLIGAFVGPTDFDPSVNTLSLPGRLDAPEGFVFQLLDGSERGDPGVLITESGGATAVTEAATTDSYSVVLKSKPRSLVVVTLNLGSQLQATPAVLAFTPDNWNQPQNVLISAIDDIIDQGTHSSSITHWATSSDADYDGIAIGSVNVTIHENAKVSIVHSNGSTAVSEGGPSDTYTIVLTKQPAATVVLGITAGTGLRTSVTKLAFTPDNWNVPRTVSVIALDDNIAEGAHTGVITHSWLSADVTFLVAPIPSVLVDINDNDQAGVVITERGGNTAVKEGGRADSYTIKLSSQPTADVTITLTADDQLSLSATQLVFTSANWNRPQTVRVTAVDDGFAEAAGVFSIQHAVTSSDAHYNGLAVSNVAVAVTDNDQAGVQIVQTARRTSVAEGCVTDTYTVQLTSNPMGEVVISLNGGTQLLPSLSTLTFNASNWNVPQTITVTAVLDGVAEGVHGGVITHQIVSSPPAYAGVAVADLSVTICDFTPVLGAVKHVSLAAASVNGALRPVSFKVTDRDTPLNMLTISVTSSNQALVADDSITMTGAKTARKLLITPTVGVTGVATITIVASDGNTSATVSFDVQVYGATVLPYVGGFNQQTQAYLGGVWNSAVGKFFSDGSAAVAAGTGFNLATLNSQTAADTTLLATVALGDGIGAAAGLAARISGKSMYYAQLSRTHLGVVAQIWRRLNGRDMLLGEALAPADAGILRFTLQDDSLQLTLNGNLLVSANDASFTSGQVGLVGAGLSTIDDFSATII